MILFEGCASPGPPKPPSLRLPSLATAAQATRIGDRVLFDWTTPPNTTDGDALRDPVTAIVCRELAAENTTAPCNPIARFATRPGPGRFSEQLPAALSTGSPSLVAYRVELANPAGRSAGLSPHVFVATGDSPPSVADLHVESRREGTLITWKPQASPAVVELRRTLVGPSRVNGATPPQTGPKAKNPAPGRLLGGEAQAPSSQPTPALVILRAEAGLPPPSASPALSSGGVLDRSVRDAETYTYTAQRVQNLTLSGHELELRSEPSAPVTVAFHNIFPPRAPRGLVSVPGGGFGSTPSIDLSWEPGPETDLLGYNVYRQQDGGPFVRLNPGPVTESAFHDAAVAPGHTYTYRITAVDARQHESAPSSEVHESLRK